jgi:hypothetical protein
VNIRDYNQCFLFQFFEVGVDSEHPNGDEIDLAFLNDSFLENCPKFCSKQLQSGDILFEDSLRKVRMLLQKPKCLFKQQKNGFCFAQQNYAFCHLIFCDNLCTPQVRKGKFRTRLTLGLLLF